MLIGAAKVLRGSVYDLEQMELARSRIPLRGLGTPEEVAAVIAFLANPAASYITGTGR